MPKKVNPRGKAASTPEVGPNPEPAKKATRKRATAKKKSDRKWVRAIRHVDTRVTFMDGHRVELKPRGQRGDMQPISKEQEDDPIFADNLGMIYEVISDEKAREVLQKQQTNQQVPPGPMDFLLNEHGKPYKQAPTIGPSNEEQASTVANIEQSGTGRYSEQNVRIERASGAAPTQVDVPGSQPLTEEELDAIARNTRGDETGEVLRQNLNVSIEPTQRQP